MDFITVNEKKCIKCEQCIVECPAYVLKMGEKGPEEVANTTCIACGHCVAICQMEAIDNKKTPLAQQVDAKDFAKLNAEQAEHFLRSRRSIRNYQDKSVSREKLTKLVDIARLAPTGSNSQGISFVVVEDKQLVKKAAELTIRMIEKSPLKDALKGLISTYREDGIDSILRGAPNLIITTADKGFSNGRANSISCLTYLELFAPSLGLGTCWAGFFEYCASIKGSPMLKLFNIPEGKTITAAVMVGYPKYSYKKLVDRNSLEVTYI
ncbi:nitroreductase family protein [Clostridium sp. CF011]|uniref:nitroreductase family protein n=1 Tax=Clostridium sp. CF011 TaxID=2843318 RepID=UPI001C0B3331|nr:nitroreductase family protein [Clostridium sp. CF011]MBU3091997.1 nitroreductase family protein [Clostridium sp. CF011]WAG71283.1 nitroreductase family protein [Clostridium sp. CF011]